MAKQCVDVDEIAQAVRQLFIVEQVRGAVQHHVRRREHRKAVPAGDRHGRAEERRCIGVHAGGFGDDRVVHVERPSSA